MSLQQAVDQWIAANHPHILSGIKKVVTKQNKSTGKKIQTESTEVDPLHDFLIEHVRNGTIELLTTGRILFPLTRHESLCKLDALESHLSGKVYRRAAIKADNESINWSEYEPYIIQHNRFPSMLFCVVTQRTLNKTRADVEAHIAGAAYQRGKIESDIISKQYSDRKEKIKRQKQARRELMEKFSTVGTNDDKYDFSNMDFGAVMDSFGDNDNGFEGDEGDMFDFDGEEGEMFDFDGEEGEFEFFDEDDEDFEFDEDFEEEEEIQIPEPKKTSSKKSTQIPSPAPTKANTAPVQVMDLSKKGKVASIVEPVVVGKKGASVTKAAAPVVAPTVVSKLDTKKSKIVQTMVESEEDEDMFDYDEDEIEFDFDEDGEGEGLSGRIDGEGEFIPGIYDGEGEFIPGMFTENGHFVSFEEMAMMMDSEGEFDSENFFDEDDEIEDEDDDIEIDVFDEDGLADDYGSDADFDVDQSDEDEDFVDDDEDDEMDQSSLELMKKFAMLRKKSESEAQKNSKNSQIKAKIPIIQQSSSKTSSKSLPLSKSQQSTTVSNKSTKSTTPVAPVSVPQSATKRKAQEQIQPPKKSAPLPPQKQIQSPKKSAPLPPQKQQKDQQQQQQTKKSITPILAPPQKKTTPPTPPPPTQKNPKKNSQQQVQLAPSPAPKNTAKSGAKATPTPAAAPPTKKGRK